MKIGFTGDVAFSEFTSDFYKNPKAISKKIYDFLDNDYNIINFESPITTSSLTRKAALAHKSSPDALNFIKTYIKNPVLSLANNHMMDFGRKGLIDTINNVRGEDIPYVGAGLNVYKATDYIILDKDVKVGIIAVQYKNYNVASKDRPGTAHDKHKKLIKKRIKSLRNKVDWIVMIYHGGEEFINTPMPYTRRKLKKYLSYGVDIIVAHHPHTVQGYEKVGKKMIFYSLGNFIFDTTFQRAQKDTDRGMLLKINFDKKGYNYYYMPIYNKRGPEKIMPDKDNRDFKNIKRGYKRNWKKAALYLGEVNKRKKELRWYRNYYSIDNLHIQCVNIKQIIPFDDLIAKNYTDTLDEKNEFRSSNIIIRKLKKIYKKIKNANYRKFFYMHVAKIFR